MIVCILTFIRRLVFTSNYKNVPLLIYTWTLYGSSPQMMAIQILNLKTNYIYWYVTWAVRGLICVLWLPYLIVYTGLYIWGVKDWTKIYIINYDFCICVYVYLYKHCEYLFFIINIQNADCKLHYSCAKCPFIGQPNKVAILKLWQWILKFKIVTFDKWSLKLL